MTHIGEQVCEALGLDPIVTNRIDLRFRHDEPPTATVQRRIVGEGFAYHVFDEYELRPKKTGEHITREEGIRLLDSVDAEWNDRHEVCAFCFEVYCDGVGCISLLDADNPDHEARVERLQELLRAGQAVLPPAQGGD